MNTFLPLTAAVLSLNGGWPMKAFPRPDDGAVRALPLPAGLAVKIHGEPPFAWADYSKWIRFGLNGDRFGLNGLATGR